MLIAIANGSVRSTWSFAHPVQLRFRQVAEVGDPLADIGRLCERCRERGAAQGWRPPRGPRLYELPPGPRQAEVVVPAGLRCRASRERSHRCWTVSPSKGPATAKQPAFPTFVAPLV